MGLHFCLLCKNQSLYKTPSTVNDFTSYSAMSAHIWEANGACWESAKLHVQKYCDTVARKEKISFRNRGGGNILGFIQDLKKNLCSIFYPCGAITAHILSSWFLPVVTPFFSLKFLLCHGCHLQIDKFSIYLYDKAIWNTLPIFLPICLSSPQTPLSFTKKIKSIISNLS